MSCRKKQITFLSKLKQGASSFTELSFIRKVCRTLNSRKYAFLMYHGIVHDNIKCAQNDWLQLNESSFYEQMSFLKKHYHVVSLKDIINNAVDASNTRPKVVITFDDGYANNYNVAFPILKKLKLPATVFLVTDAINSEKLFWYDRLFITLQKIMPSTQVLTNIEQFKHCHPHIVDEKVNDYFKNHNLLFNPSEEEFNTYRVLSHVEINKMAESGLITFGSHTHEHELLTLMTNREVRCTLSRSYETLQNIPQSVKAFCYPNGYYDKNEHVKICEEIGYRLAVKATGGSWSHNIPDYEIPRWGIGRGMDIGKFSAIVSGALYLLQRLTFKAK